MSEEITIPILSGAVTSGGDARALASRIELAVAMGQHQVATDLHRRFQALPLSDAERRRMRQEFAVLDRLP